MAEGILRKLRRERLNNYPRRTPQERVVGARPRRRAALHRAQGWAEDFEASDLLLAMDSDNLAIRSGCNQRM